MGETKNGVRTLPFDGSIKLEFRGAKITRPLETVLYPGTNRHEQTCSGQGMPESGENAPLGILPADQRMERPTGAPKCSRMP
jgi:hypothetical protein